MAIYFFRVGYRMRLGCNNRIKLSILFLFSFISMDVFAIAQWSKVGYVYRIDSKKNSSNDYDMSKCDLKMSTAGMNEDGDPHAQRDYLDIKLDQYSIVFNYGTNFKDKFFADGAFKYAQQIRFSVGENYRKPLLSALKKALKAGNCDIAQSLVDTLANGKVQKEGESDEFLGFENGTDRCAISKDGSSVCAFNKEGSDEEGNPVIGVCNETNCDRDTLENYASSKQEPKGSSGQGATDARNGINELRGSGGNSGSSPNGGSNGSAASGSGGNHGGSGHSDKGTGNGKGLGTGKSEGDGDKEHGNGDLTYPELEEFDIKKAFNELKKSKEGFIPNLSFSGGSCPPLDINFNTKFLVINEKVDVHCQVFKGSAELLSSIFLFIWGIVSLRVILSA
ncbi:hypothetical protein [Actinobacillus equuli]|uniref:Uncharacterized protein n=1 Tax=Actinobacillus equuli TaxID=718 RepID=A0AAX3FMI8_ACTEU|nr:hypothetical protein [Actinobacillus equuli]WGE45168.1 hypothetical protein NYR65_03760 [Actinobacillus equuli subsp. equuli]VEE88899.1 Uncharacterised protein [Actinobacillus equuli]VEE93144.1 Uncharacterised protein [Actinobacillus equuli]VEE93158.1 Uncharacterised protein [Actinobacillus equuli]